MDALVTDSVTLANRLRPVLLKLNRHLRRELHSLDVTAGQVAVLAAIKNSPGIGVRELASREGMSSPGMSKYVARLEAAGLVTRAADSDDRRRVGLVLTEDAQRVLRSVRSRRTAWLAARLKRLTDAEVEAIDAAIEPLTHLLEDAEA